MFFSPVELSRFWGVHPNGVVHVGAHEAEESKVYTDSNWGKIFWIEAQEELAEKIRQQLDPLNNSVICAAVWDQSGLELQLNIASNSQSSSLLDFGSGSTENSDIRMIGKKPVKTSRLDEILGVDCQADFINLDIQGAELKALQGLGDRVADFNYVYLEVNSKYVYEDCALIAEIDTYLSKKGFIRVGTRWRLFRNWGDAIYIRTPYHFSVRIRSGQLLGTLSFYVKQIFSRLFYIFSLSMMKNNKLKSIA